jgi:hypothetical protein
MPTPTPIREKLLALVADRLADVMSDIPVERARRSIPSEDIEGEFPRLIVKGGDLTSSDGEGFGETTYAVEAVVTGYAKASPYDDDQDLSCEQALSALHARVVAALVGWQPDGTDLNEVRDGGGASFIVYDLEESAVAAGEFSATFEAVSIRPTGHPYAAA